MTSSVPDFCIASHEVPKNTEMVVDGAVCRISWLGSWEICFECIQMNGFCCSSRTRDCSLAVLCDRLVKRQTRFFTNEDTCVFSIDNYSKGIKLKDMCGSNSNAQLEGTMEMAHQVKPFIDTTWDELHVKLEYMAYQNIPLTVCMVDYTAYAKLLTTNLFSSHKSMSPSVSPCINGPCCTEYDHRLTQSK